MYSLVPEVHHTWSNGLVDLAQTMPVQLLLPDAVVHVLILTPGLLQSKCYVAVEISDSCVLTSVQQMMEFAFYLQQLRQDRGAAA